MTSTLPPPSHPDLFAEAQRIRRSAFGLRTTFSPKVFIPLTKLCRDRCGYCTFAQPPARLESPYLEIDEVLEIARDGAAAGCHDDGARAGQLVLGPGRSHAQLVGVAAKNVGAVDDGLLRVKAGDSEASFLVIKVRDHVPVRYGVRMPWTGDALTDDGTAAIEAWIDNGAPND